MKLHWSQLVLSCLLVGCVGSEKRPIQPASTGEQAGPTDEGGQPGELEPGPASSSADAAARLEDVAARETVGEQSPTEPLPEGTKVLHVGDSFAGALGLPLGKLLQEHGVKSVLKHTDASYLTDWAWNGDLQKMLWKYNPDLLIITLGANELSITEPEQRKKTIAKIMKVVGDRPCLWVAIPLWDGKHNGLMDVIRDNVGSCVYWDSNELIDVEHMARISDGIHPTAEARADWARVVFDWLRQHRKPTDGRPWALEP